MNQICRAFGDLLSVIARGIAEHRRIIFPYRPINDMYFSVIDKSCRIESGLRFPRIMPRLQDRIIGGSF